jgi:histidinol-phosphate aminotransferase
LVLKPRPEISNLRVSEHGGPNYGELEALGLSPGEVIDFSVSSNPNGPPPGLRIGAKDVHIDRYPDSEAGEMRRCLAQKLGVMTRNILVGSGSTELIRLATLAYLGRGDRAIIIEPTFGEYEVACHIMGASIIRQRLVEENGFTLDVDRTIELIRQHRPQVIFICNPNNPTGHYLDRTRFERILATASDCLVILDEAYILFVDSAWSWIDMIGNHNLLVLRSMTKDYTLAGLRLGYAIAREDIISTLRRVCPPWNVNSVAQRAGILALQQDEFLERSRALAAKGKNYLVQELTRLGLRCLPSEANFFLVEVGNASDFRQWLLRKKILVRDCTSFGLPHHIRIAPRGLRKCQQLVSAIKELQGEK